ncbi:hypothetical protein ABZZ79_37945 [Streptomyces sp. NPDC006458]|uniref:hypothetical protein n=1 Tax=Streptomyces sp. NPDC006458 TaxID=3154302 RepID=UPI0033B6AC22
MAQPTLCLAAAADDGERARRAQAEADSVHAQQRSQRAGHHPRVPVSGAPAVIGPDAS